MTHSNGFRSGTRSKFSKKFRKHGMPHLSKQLTVYKRGDYVTILGDPSIQKGMPHHQYHGKTAVVYDVTPRAVGVKLAKRVRHREMLKSFHVRIEHVKKSRCREDFLARCAANKAKFDEFKGQKLTPERRREIIKEMKRQPQGPRSEVMLKNCQVTELAPIAFTEYF